MPKITKNSALGGFVTKKPSCLNCNRISEEATCADCKDKEVDIFLKKQEEQMRLAEDEQHMMVECNKCQQFVTNPVICANFDCPIFYRRHKVRKELELCESQLERFTTSLAW